MKILQRPLPSVPSVTIYETVIIALSSSFLPKTPSPNNNSYLSFVVSCIRYVSDVFVMFNILSTLRYSLPMPGSEAPFT